MENTSITEQIKGLVEFKDEFYEEILNLKHDFFKMDSLIKVMVDNFKEDDTIPVEFCGVADIIKTETEIMNDELELLKNDLNNINSNVELEVLKNELRDNLNERMNETVLISSLATTLLNGMIAQNKPGTDEEIAYYHIGTAEVLKNNCEILEGTISDLIKNINFYGDDGSNGD